MVGKTAKKLIVPTVHPVGPIGAPMQPRGFSKLYASAFLGVDQVSGRPLPKSKYIPSPYGFVVPVFSPSQMNTSAYLHWMTKLSRPRGRNLTSAEYMRAKEILVAEFSPYVKPSVSTLEQVLADIDWEKSPGWPYVNMGCSTKRQAWEKYSDLITERAMALTRGEYVECVFIASLKDELLPPGKNARVFLPAPFHHQLACAILFKSSVDSLTNSVHNHSSAVGINIFGRGLERCLRSLNTLPFGYDADQSGCDTSWKDAEPERDFLKVGLPIQYHAGVDMLFNTAMCPRVIVGENVLQLEMNPSGWYLTTMVNTLMTHRTVAASFMDLSPEVIDIPTMRKHLLQVNGGDDLCYSTDCEWFTITALAADVARRGMYLESDVLSPRDPMSLTFFSHNLFLRTIDCNNSLVYVAGGRLSKILSSFSYLKVKDGKVNWHRSATRVVGLMMNLWPYKREFDIVYPYLYHMIHHFFLQDGQKLTSEWSGVFRSIPCDEMMLVLRNGHNYESGYFFPTHRESSFSEVKRVLQSALKSETSPTHIDTMQTSKHSTRHIDNVLDSLEKSHGLTEDGRNWLIAAADPFHDFDLHLSGYPDVTTDASIVQLVKRQFVVRKPSGLGAGNWDCRIDYNPCQNGLALNYEYDINDKGFITNGTAGTGRNLSGVTATAVLANNSMTFNGVEAGTAQCTEFLISGPSRIVAAGIEITNTTAEIYKQGSVTVFRVPNLSEPRQVVYNDGAFIYPITYQAVELAPDTVYDANAYFGSRTWAASEGAYVIARQNGTVNKFRYNAGFPAIAVVPPTDPLGDSRCFVTDTVNDTLGFSQSYCTPFDLSGAYFTGLSEQTTLNVTVRWFVERQPTIQNPDLLVLATPSAGYDPLALEIYTRAMAHQPPGVMISENPLGEWFKKVLKGVSDWAPKIGTALGAIGVPGAATIGNLVGGGARLIMPKQKEKPLEDSASHTEAPPTVARRPKPLPKSRRKARTMVGGKKVK